VYDWRATWASVWIDATGISRWKTSLPELFSGVPMATEQLLLVTDTMKRDDSDTRDYRTGVALAQ
jgi:TRAP-type C4-dicarboxylate transport system permease small subunit